MKKFLQEFKEFAMRGNMIDMAVGIIIGAAFGKIVSSLVADVIMPPLGLLIGGVDFTDLAITLKRATGDDPAVLLRYGAFLQTVVDFLIVAFAIFLMVKGINSLRRKQADKPAPAAPPAPTAEEKLLTEIRDLLKKETAEKGIDLMMVRELTGGIYFGEKGVKDTDLGPAAYDIEQYAEEEVRRIAKVAFDMAMKRSKHVTSVDKANVLESSRLWRRVVTEVAKDYPEVTLDHLYVDNAAMQLVRNPRQFDVIVTSNIFGDILSDEASQITGSIGMLPSASLAQGNFGMYEPVHGSAPDIAGQDKANPMATILSAAMMLRYTFGLGQEADAIENAVKSVLDQGYRTPDLFAGEGTLVGTAEMGRRIAEAI